MLILICGVGRSGKTTYSEKFNGVIHLDLMGHLPDRYDNVNNIISDKNDVVIEGIYNLKEQRMNLIRAYKGTTKKCIWLNPEESIVKNRLKHDKIPVIISHFEFEPPTLEEGWDEIIILRGE